MLLLSLHHSYVNLLSSPLSLRLLSHGHTHVLLLLLWRSPHTPYNRHGRLHTQHTRRLLLHHGLNCGGLEIPQCEQIII